VTTENIINNGNAPLPLKIKPSPLNKSQMQMYDEEEY
jgi:hypothetical protein